MKERVDVTMGRQRSPRHAQGDDVIPYLRAANVKDGELALDDVLEMNFSPSEREKFALRRRDVLVTEGCGSLAQIGASARWNDEIKGPVGFQNTLLRLRAIDGVTDPEFVYQWARWAFESGAFANTALGTSIFHIGAKRAAEMPFPDLPIDEQRRIADVLASADAAIESQCTAVGRLEELLAASRNTLVSGDAVLLGDLIDRIGVGESPRCLDRLPRDDEWGVLKISAVRPARFDATQVKTLPEGIAPRMSARLSADDLLMTRSNTLDRVGAACVASGDVDRLLLSDLVFRIELDQRRMLHEYAAQALCSRQVRDQIEASAVGTSGSMQKVNQGIIRNLHVPTPTIDDQEAIVAHLKAIEAVISAMKTSLDDSLNARTALLRTLVSGSHRIPESYDRLLAA